MLTSASFFETYSAIQPSANFQENHDMTSIADGMETVSFKTYPPGLPKVCVFFN
jgi:hypothetical protein